MPKLSHISELDGVRGFAISMVVLFHFAKDLPHNSIVNHITSLGWTGVDLFFVLSGFLITGILLRSRQSPEYLQTFYIRRALRIFPVYYVALIIIIPLFSMNHLFRGLLPVRQDLIVNVFYLGNWTPLLRTVNQQSLAHLWSLAVEEQFYLIWPFLILLVSRRRLPLVAATGCMFSLLLRIGLQHWPDFTYRNTFCRMDSLMIGSLCAMWPIPEWLSARSTYIALITGLLLLIAVVVDYRLGDTVRLTIGLTLFGLAYGGVLLTSLHGPAFVKAALRTPPLTVLGKYSYGIYIFHQPVYFALTALHLISRGWATFFVALGSSVSLAVISYTFLEKPILRFKDRIAPTGGNDQLSGRGAAAQSESLRVGAASPQV